MTRSLGMLFALSAMFGGPDGRPGWSPDPRVPQTPDSAAAALARAEEKRRRKAARRSGGAR